MYLNLIMRTLKSDMNIKRVKAFVKRMLQVLALHQPPFICGALYVIIQLEALIPGLATLIAEPEEHRESRQIESRDELGSSYNGLYASTIMEPGETQKPDLESHSLIRFLDKFAYRNPKAKELNREGSPVARDDGIEGEDDRIWNALVPDRSDDESSLGDLEFPFTDSEPSNSDLDDDEDKLPLGEEGTDGVGDIEQDVEEEDHHATGDTTSQRSRKRKLRDLPMFASAEDYAALLAKEADS
ncbi:unnamed protein product [Parascedosporium putredinis]|uniref:CCAAT-binding factor domain-containing protein n=1 Tax=Parascedosporium putredinis TaxID=1442378 RepID=A0A9P1H7Y2_9PEZI|nr:unnamed protein product [Parascedosporium putredinis]CAI8000280.1 unnamed protein product [Parascedosporium putredinis]